MPIDLRKAIADRQERDAIKKAIGFVRDGANQFRPVPDQLVGFHELQLRFVAALETGADDYTDGLSVLAGLMTTLAGAMGYAVASLPMSAGAHAGAYWEEAMRRSLRTYKASGRAALDDQARESKVEKPAADLSTK